MSDLWIAYEAAARGIAKQRRGKEGDPDPEPTATDRLLARAAIDEALPHVRGGHQAGPDAMVPPPAT